MADALMKYETIDAEQIDDIMDGRVPREPKDWDSSDTTPPPGALSDKVGEDTPIGGPASEH